MQLSNNTIFDSTNGYNGNWINIGKLTPGSSLHIVGLEADGKLQVKVSNSDPTVPPATTGDATVVLLSTINGVTGGAPQMVQALSLPVQWLQIVKVPGAVPTETEVKHFGQIA